MESNRRISWQFSLRTLLVGVSVWCVLAYYARHYPHVLLFLFALFGVVACTAHAAIQHWKGHKLGRRFVGLTAVAWFIFYVASVGPAAMFFEGPGVADEICEVVYGPLLIADNQLPTRPIDNYADKWKRMMQE